MTRDRPTSSAVHGDDRFARIVALAADAIMCIDNRQCVTLFNDGAERTFGYTRDEIIGKPLNILIPDRFRRSHEGHVDRFSQSSPSSRHMGARQAIYALRKNGEEFPAEATISKIDVGDEHVLTVVLRDITPQKLVETQLEARVAERTAALQAEVRRRELAQGQLVRSQRMEAYGQLTGGVAHDFNNLLTIIGGNLELLQDRLSDVRNRKLLDRALNAVGMGARLTQRLLAFARRSRLEPKTLDLNEQVTGIIDLLRRTLGESIAILPALSPDIWAVRADPGEIENALINLAINARDAMPGGGKLYIATTNVTIDESFCKASHNESLTPGDYVQLSVEDTGHGMAPDVLARVFEPFFTTKEPGRGTGLGLASIYGFARQSGGHVTIFSEAGKGAEVKLYLPRVAAKLEKNGAGRGPGASTRITRGTILIVEDNADVRDVTVERIEELGYRALASDSGPAAIAVLERASRVDLVFSDAVMAGGMSGFDLAAWIKEHRPDVKVILTSGFTEEILAGEQSASAGHKLLRKPYSTADLARVLIESLGEWSNPGA
jgi:PAS domain S-box-containing protein